MFVQKLRERVGARLRNEESGFTLVELLVVMLILGLLAAIAIPSFFNQRDKGNDAQTKSLVRTAQTAIETYATDNGGVYTGATPAALIAIEDTLNEADGLAVTASASGYTVSANTVETGNSFEISRDGTTGTVGFDCTVQGEGGCPTGGDWGN